MIVIDTTYSANTITLSLSERLNEYGLSTFVGRLYYLDLINPIDMSLIKSISLVDISPLPVRYNLFNLPSSFYSGLSNGQYKYIAYADESATQVLEYGKVLITGAVNLNDVYL